jgi:TM2 domain-containing membrane protein YozV
MIHYFCPHCSGRLEVEESAAGESHDCPNCGLPLHIPSPNGGTATIGTEPDHSPEEPLDALPVTQPGDPSQRIAVGVCAILFGWFGVHHFLLGRVALGIPSVLLGILGLVVFVLALFTGCPGFVCAFLPLLLVTWGKAIYDGVCYLKMSDQQFALRLVAFRTQAEHRVPTLWLATILYGIYILIGLALAVVLALRLLLR